MSEARLGGGLLRVGRRVTPPGGDQPSTLPLVCHGPTHPVHLFPGTIRLERLVDQHALRVLSKRLRVLGFAPLFDDANDSVH